MTTTTRATAHEIAAKARANSAEYRAFNAGATIAELLATSGPWTTKETAMTSKISDERLTAAFGGEQGE